MQLFNASFAFMRSAQHDVRAIHDIVKEAHDSIHTYLSCGEVCCWFCLLLVVVLVVLCCVGCCGVSVVVLVVVVFCVGW